jgi:DNA adenine methylase
MQSNKLSTSADKLIKTPLRYPGGKSRAICQIIPCIPDYDEFREPFVGGGSVFLAAMQMKNPKAFYRIRDLNYEVYYFWNELKTNGEKLVAEIQRFKDSYSDGRKLFEFMVAENNNRSTLDRAARFFVLNRITFSGTTDSGGYSEEAFKKRFTQSSIERLKPFPKLIEKVEITYGDYETLLLEPARDEKSEVFVFLDPPYHKPSKSKLYGKNGDLHISFNHVRFAESMKKCSHKWLITYDDSDEVRKLFDFANIYKWQLQYGMNNVSISGKAEKGNELFITNFKIPKRTEQRVLM